LELVCHASQKGGQFEKMSEINIKLAFVAYNFGFCAQTIQEFFRLQKKNFNYCPLKELQSEDISV
jgi:hypothetical protein